MSLKTLNGSPDLIGLKLPYWKQLFQQNVPLNDSPDLIGFKLRLLFHLKVVGITLNESPDLIGFIAACQRESCQ